MVKQQGMMITKIGWANRINSKGIINRENKFLDVVLEAPEITNEAELRNIFRRGLAVEIRNLIESHVVLVRHQLLRQLFDLLVFRVVCRRRRLIASIHQMITTTYLFILLDDAVSSGRRRIVVREIEFGFAATDSNGCRVVGSSSFLGGFESAKPDTNTFPRVTNLSRPFAPWPLPYPSVHILPLSLILAFFLLLFSFFPTNCSVQVDDIKLNYPPTHERERELFIIYKKWECTWAWADTLLDGDTAFVADLTRFCLSKRSSSQWPDEIRNDGTSTHTSS